MLCAVKLTCRAASSCIIRFTGGVSIVPGQIALTRIPSARVIG